MTENQLDRLEKRFDKIDGKLDAYADRIARVEEKQSGQIKIIYVLITTGISGILAWISSQFK